MHREVKGGIVILRGAKQAPYPNLHAEFLAYLAHQCLMVTLLGLYLATRKLPPSFPIPIATLRGKVLPFVLYNSCNNFYVFHRMLGLRFRLRYRCSLWLFAATTSMCFILVIIVNVNVIVIRVCISVIVSVSVIACD